MIQDYQDEIELIFAKAAEGIQTFPAGLRELGLALLERSYPKSGGGTNAISFLLPYWYGEQIGSARELCRELAVGNLYAMLHFFLLDDAMDGDPVQEGASSRGSAYTIRGALAVSQLLHDRFLASYQRHFTHDSLLWSYYRHYMEEWAAIVYAEATSPIDPNNPKQLAGKAAPVKLCAAALLIQMGLPERIPVAEQAIELVLAVLQLSDDWSDWTEDIHTDPNCNAFLSLVRDKLGLSDGVPLDGGLVKRAIYHKQVVEELAIIAEGYRERLQQLPHVPSALITFQQAMVGGLREDAQRIEKSILSLVSGGGFSHFLANSQN